MSARRPLTITTMTLIATMLPAAAGGAGRPLELRLSSGVFRPPVGATDGGAARISPETPGWYHADTRPTSPKGLRYLVAVSRESLTPGQRAQIEAAGAELLGYIPDHGYEVRVNGHGEAAVRALSFVAWLGEIPPHLKTHPDLSAIAQRQDPGPAKVRVILRSGETEHRVNETLAGLKLTSTPSGKDGAWRVEATVPPGRLGPVLSRLCGLPEVEAIEPARPFRLLNQDAVWVHQSFVGPSAPQTPIFNAGIFGCGQILAISDSGQDYGSCFFEDPTNGAPPITTCLAPPCPVGVPAPTRRKDIIYYNWSGTPTGDDDICQGVIGASGHGTHTSGSAVADSAPFADCAAFGTSGRNGGDGQAPGAKLVVEEMGDGLEYLNNLGGTVWNLADVAYRSGARIHTNSWGGACQDGFGSCIPGCTIPYDSFARDADLAMWTYPDLLLVFSAGNAAQFCPPPVSVSSPAIAKSVVSVGSVGHGVAANVPSGFSSPGPVFDGRLKPTVSAQGESVVSVASDASPATINCDTCSLDGTSMAAPTTAGLAALVREYYTAGYYAAGVRNASAGFVPSAALLKATLIDGAVALGAAAPAADFDSGFGRVLLNTTLALSGSPFKLRVDDYREGLVTGGVVTHAYDVAGGTPLRVTLTWTDYPAALNAAVARVNELKLEVIDPSGTVWFQTLDTGTGAPRQTSNASDPHDALNVEERLVFANPAPGRWSVRVSGVDVAWGPQPFALVVRGALTDCPAPQAPAAPVLTTPADHEVLVSWGGVPSAAVYNVYRSLGACPAVSWLQVASGVGGTSFLDTGISGGASWSYRVAAASDTAAFCESPRSPCASIVPTGDCTLDPDFPGVSGAVSAGQAECGINLSWNPITSVCGGAVRYNIYRATSTGFVPGSGNRIAQCVNATTYTDTADLVHGGTYYYVVRAEDATTGHGGPCNGGNEDGNAHEALASPAGPPMLGTWADDAGDTGIASFLQATPWTVAAGGGAAGPKVYTAESFAQACADLTSPAVTLAAPGEGPQLIFSTRHDLEYDPIGFLGAEGSLGQVEIATGPGFSNWTRVPLTPDYPTLVELPLNVCASTGNAETYFSDIATTYATYTASLANWAGGAVKVRFHLSGDLIYPGGNWWIDDVQITKAFTAGACTTSAAGPPPVPDGSSVPGQPLGVTRSGANLQLTWDAALCPAAAVNVYWGVLGSFGAFAGGVCDLPDTGSATVALPDNVWFLVVSTDGGSTDGSWSRGGLGNELTYTGASAVCPAITRHVTTSGCF